MGVNLGNFLRAVKQADLIVSPTLNRWLLSNPETLPVRDDIAKRVLQLIKTPPRDRTRSFSCSAAGQCHRKQVFDYLGTKTGKDVLVEPQLARIFANGTWNHLRTQVALLASGIATDIEIVLNWRKMRCKGSVDAVGVVPDTHPKTNWRNKEFGIEFKTANSNVFRMLRDAGPYKYRQQVARYLLLSGWELFVILVENKDNQELLEWVIEPEPSELSAQEAELRALNKAVDTKMMPPMLPECARMTGKAFRDCPYGGRTGACVQTRSWPDL